LKNLKNKNILVAPLNWGLGHATRCIPIINALENHGFTPILASDGMALELLKKEFPKLQILELPSYNIKYSKKGIFFKLKLIANSPKTIKAILNEKKVVKKWVKEYNLSGIISDNRLGVRNKKIPSVFITHQLNVMTGNTTWITSKMHQFIINKFDKCWVPDVANKPNLTGYLGHLKKKRKNIKYIGPLSRLKKETVEIKYDLMVILSGPEPQRTFLEEKLALELHEFQGKIVFIKGKIEETQMINTQNHITYYNYMNSIELEKTFNESNIVLCRSGYTTIMDLAQLEKKAFFIPTPGQYEQVYLAKKLKIEGLVPYCTQQDFTISKLLEVDFFRGLSVFKTNTKWDALFKIFTKK
jgi:uncharacterized protein (TIGR00661 family)